MREDDLDPVVLVPKSIDNSQVVREVDPRSFRDLALLLLLVTALVGGLVLYAWPHLQLRETAMAKERLSRERERLVEENRKLRLEKATLSSLRRVETIAVRDLGLARPPAERVIVVERPRPVPAGAHLASGEPSAVERN
jgi:cell division protein FtsL